MAIQTFQTLYEYAIRHWGNASATGDSLDLIKKLVNRAYSQALQKYPWRFLHATHTLSLTIGKNAYQLPEDFERMVTDEIPYAEIETFKVLRRRDITTIRRWRIENEGTGQPQVFDIIPLKYSEETGSSWKIEVYPTPGTSYSAIVYYRMNPGELVNDNHLIIGHQAFYNLVEQMVLAEIELIEDEKVGPQNAKVSVLLQDAIEQDKANEPDTLGSYLLPRSISNRDTGNDYNYSNIFGS